MLTDARKKKLATGWAVVTIWTSLGENLIYIFTKLPWDEQKAVHCMQFLSVHLWISLINDLNSVVNFWESSSGKLWEMKISQPIIISLIKDSGLLFQWIVNLLISFFTHHNWEQLQNTPQLIYMSLNKNSVYCVMPRSSKPPDTCKWVAGYSEV